MCVCVSGGGAVFLTTCVFDLRVQMPKGKLWFPLRLTKCTGNKVYSCQRSHKLPFFFFKFLFLFWPGTKIGYARVCGSTRVKYFSLACLGV